MLNDDEQGSSSGSLFAPSRQLTIVVPLLWALCGPEREWRVLPRCVPLLQNKVLQRNGSDRGYLLQTGTLAGMEHASLGGVFTESTPTIFFYRGDQRTNVWLALCLILFSPGVATMQPGQQKTIRLIFFIGEGKDPRERIAWIFFSPGVATMQPGQQKL